MLLCLAKNLTAFSAMAVCNTVLVVRPHGGLQIENVK